MTVSDYFPARDDGGAPQLERRTERGLGGAISLRQDRASLLLATLFGAMSLSLAGALWFGHFAKSETVRGLLTTAGGSARIEAPRAGVIAEIRVRQGDRVHVGDRLAVLRLPPASSDGKSAAQAERRALDQKRLALSAEMSRDQLLIDEAKLEMGSLEKEEAALADAFGAQEQTLGSALKLERASVGKLTGLMRQGYATNDMLDQHRRALVQYQRDLTDSHLQRIREDQSRASRLMQLRATIAEKAGAYADADTTLSNLGVRAAELAAGDRLDLVAQSDGQVLTLAAKPGDSVEPGQMVAVTGDPAAAPLIVLDAPASAIGLARIGQRVVLKYDAFPFKTFGVSYGEIVSISAAPVRAAQPDKPAGEAADPRELRKQAFFRIEVKPEKSSIRAYGADQQLAIGSTLSADIIVERRRLIDWVLDPIRAMAGRT